MIELSLAEIATMVGGQLAGGAQPTTRVTAAVEFDSRQITTGGLFLAVPGERQDGHDFAAAASAAGAVAVLASQPVLVPNIQVADPLAALADLARAVVRRLPWLVVVGVTGSAGKTSTKDLLAQLLAHVGPTIAAPASFNNELGHPYTVLRADPATRFLILELSARGIGHIRYLTEIAPPRIGVVLNVGSAHLGEFGSREAIALAKGELVEALPAAADGGIAVLNGDDPAVRAMASRTSARVVLVGRAADCGVRASRVSIDELGRASFTIETRAGSANPSARVTMALTGEHHVGNAVAAAAVALECGLSLDAVAAALSRAVPVSRWRMQVTTRTDGVLIINDAYNANPESMRAALSTLDVIGSADSSRRTWAVLGHMAELGDSEPTEHETLGRLVAPLAVHRLVVVGEQARPIAAGAVLEGWAAGEPDWVPDVDAAIRLLLPQLRAGDVVLVKASRSAGLERIALALIEDDGGAGRGETSTREGRE